MRAYTALLLQQQQREICQLVVFRSTNHRAFRMEFCKIPFGTIAIRILQITHCLICGLLQTFNACWIELRSHASDCPELI